jgi:antitoxin ParD1/3/4
MASSRQIVITLAPEMVELVQKKVTSGQYANESEVISDGLSFLEDEDKQLERWLREEVVLACREYDDDPSSAISSAELMMELSTARLAKSLT